jgi:hypothetical protein
MRRGAEIEAGVPPLVWFTSRAHAVLDQLLASGARAGVLGVEETADCVEELSRLISRVEGVKAALVAHADTLDVAAEAVPTVATSTGAWLARATRTPTGQARRQVRVAQALDRRYPATLDAALAGTVNAAQAEVITTALDGLPTWVSSPDRARAEEHLVGLAADHDARTLKVLARHLLHVIDPDAADEELGSQLAAEEAAAARRTLFTMVDTGDGTCRGSFRIPSVHGTMLAAALQALASPTRPDPIPREVTDADGTVTVRGTPEVLGEAFTQLLERFPAKTLPKTGGGLVTVLVTIPLRTLQDGLGAAALSTGGHLSVGATRRLACQAGLIPQVLGSKSELLDQGRRVRLHTPAQRIAIASRDKACTAEDCTIPAAWCHAHHDIPWAQGGATSVKDGRMLCPRHHRLIHHTDYRHERLPGGRVRITKIRNRQ